MKRFLSWIVLGVAEWVLGIAVWYTIYFGLWLFNLIYHKVEVLFWVLIVVYGLGAVGAVIIALIAGAKGVASVSQAVWKSKRGARYVVVGLITFLLMGAATSLVLAGLIRGGDLLQFGLYTGFMALFGLSLIFVGRSVAAENGPPPTKKEILQAKLAKLEEREQDGQDA